MKAIRNILNNLGGWKAIAVLAIVPFGFIILLAMLLVSPFIHLFSPDLSDYSSKENDE